MLASSQLPPNVKSKSKVKGKKEKSRISAECLGKWRKVDSNDGKDRGHGPDSPTTSRCQGSPGSVASRGCAPDREVSTDGQNPGRGCGPDYHMCSAKADGSNFKNRAHQN